MKYLNPYKLFESDSDDEIKSTIDDILLDLEDEGFECNCNLGWSYKNALSVELRVYRTHTTSDGHGGIGYIPSRHSSEYEFWNDIEDVMNRIYSYLSGISNKIKLNYILDGSDGEENVSIRLKENTLKRLFPDYYVYTDGCFSDFVGCGFTIYFEIDK